jgi:cytochrome oxidase assembly protein ShyY1
MTRAQWRKPSLRSSLPFLVLITLCLTAAAWQWRRAEYKERLAAEFAMAEASAPQSLSSALDSTTGGMGERVRIQGRLDRDRVILLDNRIRDGQYGVDVYAPIHDVDGRRVLVGLGWIAADRSRRQLPVIPPFGSEVEAIALLTDPPASGLRLGADAIPDPPRFPLLLSRIDIPALRTLLNLPGLADRIAVLEADPASGFLRSWQLPGLSADRHRGYALQWLSFAVGTLVFFILWHRPRKDPRS